MRKTIIIILFCVAILLAGYAGHRSYKVWKSKHLMNLARDFVAKSDFRNAALSVQAVLRSDPNNLEATRMMAQFADASRSPAALIWRSRAVEMDPHSLNDRLALAQTALVHHDYADATNALEGVDDADKKTAAYQNVAGTVAASANHLAEAETHFIEASRLDPQNPAPQLSLAVVRLHTSNTLELAEARNTLDRLASNPTNSVLRCKALRELTQDAMSHHLQDSALAMSRQLMEETNSTFPDRILRLEVLKEARSGDFKSTLDMCRREAANKQGEISELATWEMANTSSADALAWLRRLPINTQTNQPTTLLIAECYTERRDWPGLQAWLEKQHWAELDFTRHAFLSRALRGQELADAGKAQWDQALQSANGQKQSLVMLLRMAAGWNWAPEGEELLWTIVNRYPQEKWANQALTRVLMANGRTQSLMQLFKQEAERNPSDLTAKNNLAMTALLLGAKELNPNAMAQQVYQQAPTNASFASTYAYSLYLQGKSAEALKVMQRLTPQDLGTPNRAGYYGLILKKLGSNVDAKNYLDLSSKARLLPEERTLFDRAKIGI